MAGFSNLYPNLPGMLVEFKDGGMALRTDPNPPNTDSMLILGTSIDGPVMEPVAVDINTAELVFGKDIKANGIPNGSTLIPAFKQAWDSGCRDIRLMRVTGAVGKTVLKTPTRSLTEQVRKDENIGSVEGCDETTIHLLHPVVVEGSLKVYAKGILLNTGCSIVALTGDVTIADGACDAGANLSITYKYTLDLKEYSSTETGLGAEPFVALTSLQVISLTLTPVVDSVHLYVNGAEVLTKGAFTVTTNSISIKKELFAKGSELSVSYYNVATNDINETLEISSLFGGTVYGEAIVQVEGIVNSTSGKLISITKPVSKRGQVTESPLIYTSVQYPTFGQLVNAINFDTNNGVFKATTDYPLTLVENITATKGNLTGCDDGIVVDKDILFKALSGERDSSGLTKQGAYQLLEDYQVDWVVPVGVYADTELSQRYDSFAYELALFCAVLSYRNKTTLGGISMKPCVDTGLSGIQEYAKKLTSYFNFYIMKDATGNVILDSEGNAIDLGKFISVVAGPDPVMSDTSLGSFNGDAATGYIAMNTLLLPQSAPTNKRLTGAKALRFRFSNAQLDAITGNRIVTFKTKQNNNGNDGVFVVDGITAARVNSDYARLTTSKVIRSVSDQLREVCDPFIGESNTTEQKNAMAASISKRLLLDKEKGEILDYTFQIITTPLDQVLGQAKIELTIVPPQELRKITTIIGLKSTL